MLNAFATPYLPNSKLKNEVNTGFNITQQGARSSSDIQKFITRNA